MSASQSTIISTFFKRMSSKEIADRIDSLDKKTVETTILLREAANRLREHQNLLRLIAEEEIRSGGEDIDNITY